MDMQDKDLDKLFQSAFDGLEIQPSSNVWEGVKEHLDAGKRKKPITVYLSIAATVLLLVTAGILFIPKQAGVVKPGNKATARNQPEIIKPVTPAIEVVAPVRQALASNKNRQHLVITPAGNLASAKKRAVTQNSTSLPQEPVTTVNSSAKTDDMQVLASADPVKDITKPVVPDTGIKIVPRQIVDENQAMANNVAPQAIQQQTPVIASKQAAPVKKHKIRSLGDVFNVMIAAVDKRKDKFIEFSNTDEADATITGVNLGIIKVKKEK